MHALGLVYGTKAPLGPRFYGCEVSHYWERRFGTRCAPVSLGEAQGRSVPVVLRSLGLHGPEQGLRLVRPTSGFMREDQNGS